MTAPAVVTYTLTRPLALAVGDRVQRAQIGAPTLPMAGAKPVRVVSIEIAADCVAATVSERGRGGEFTRRMVWNLRVMPDTMALVVDESVEEG